MHVACERIGSINLTLLIRFTCTPISQWLSDDVGNDDDDDDDDGKVDGGFKIMIMYVIAK